MSNDVSEDLIVEIFSRLPAKSLLRFRSLSKSLHACIGSPRFIRLHTIRSTKRFTIIHRTREGKACSKLVYTLHSESQLRYNPYIGVTPVEYSFDCFCIVGSCNGILCVCEDGKTQSINLWNPSIRRKVTVHLTLDWGHSPFEFGFGFDPSIDDYKILRIRRASSCIYTLKTRAWREIASPTTPFAEVNSYHCLFNGGLHCLVTSYVNDSRYLDHDYILKFDLSSEVFSTIELPEPSNWKTSTVLTVLKDCLAAVSSTYDGYSWIWVMSEYGNPASWFVGYKFNTSHFESVDRVLQLTANDELLWHHYFERIIVYNPKTDEHSRLVELSDSSRMIDIATCVESLELLDMGSSC